jgi:putative proteasome-type protease
MTYCVGVLLEVGMVFASDSRTNAGVDHVSSFRKMTVYERPGDRVIVVLSSGNLSVTQNAINLLEGRSRGPHETLPNIWSTQSMFDAATLLGDALRDVKRRDAAYLTQNNVDANANFIIGGQIGEERQRLFMMYQEGNFIEATPDTPFFQIGETKYGKPIIDRVVNPSTSVIDAAKCVLISFDSTMRSNVSVGLPIDLVTYAKDSLRIQLQRRITETDPYFSMIHQQWGEGLRSVFARLPDPYWDDAGAT